MNTQKFRALILFSLGFVTSGFSYADNWGVKQTIVGAYTFSPQAYGKDVKSVSVHTGVVKERSYCSGEAGTFWDSVQDIPMQKIASGLYFAKAQFSPSSGECQPLIHEPVVQYFIEFADGSKMVTDSVPVHIDLQTFTSGEEFVNEVAKLGDEFKNLSEATETHAWGAQYQWSVESAQR